VSGGAPKLPYRGLLRIGILISLIVAANFAATWLIGALDFDIRPTNEEFVHRTIMAAAAAYTALLSVPFVPSVEIGLAIIGLLGTRIIPLVYVCTVGGLSLSFLVGRLLPFSWIVGAFEFLKFRRVSAFLAELEPMDTEARLEFLVRQAPNKLIPFLLRHRHLTLAVLLNLPGNIVIGGGGGICLIAGLSRLVSLPGFLITTMIAVAPVPLAILLFGMDLAK
jgi:hypothetical protein